MKRPRIVPHQFYHVYNRGVEKRDIFLDEEDYFRFIHDMFEFNDVQPALNLYYKSHEIRSRKIEEERRSRKLLVKILAFCLMPNHFHLLLEQVRDKGITEFLRKLSLGYAMYFNKKYNRSGTLFQGRFKIVVVANEAQFIHLPYYIHLNPLDLIVPEWRERKISDYKKAIQFLEKYRWSSYLDYIGQKNFPSVTQREFLLKFFNGSDTYKKATVDWLRELKLVRIEDVKID